VTPTLGQQAYDLRTTGLFWRDIATRITGNDEDWYSLYQGAKYYAHSRNKPWPLSFPRAGVPIGRGKLADADLTRPAREICVEYNCTPAAVSAARRKAGLLTLTPTGRVYPRRGRMRPWTRAEEDKAHRLRRAGFSLAEIAEELGRTTQAVQMKVRPAAGDEGAVAAK